LAVISVTNSPIGIAVNAVRNAYINGYPAGGIFQGVEK
jgi:hypothetical protein